MQLSARILADKDLQKTVNNFQKLKNKNNLTMYDVLFFEKSEKLYFENVEFVKLTLKQHLNFINQRHKKRQLNKLNYTDKR